jgi:predicted kinase
MPALRLTGDEWMVQLGFDLYDEAARDRIEVLFWQLAQQLLVLGQSVILESGFWLRSDRDEKRLGGRALGASVELHYLDVPIGERWRRIETRNAEGIWGAVSRHLVTRDMNQCCYKSALQQDG